jgi:hypothetical protein
MNKIMITNVLASISILLMQTAGMIAAIKGDTATVVWCVANQGLAFLGILIHNMSYPEN